MADTKRLLEFTAKTLPVIADVLYVGDSENSYAEVKTTLAQLITAFPALSSLNELTTTADKLVYTTAANTYATSDLTSFMRTLLDDANADAALATLGATKSGTALPLAGGTVTGTLLLAGTQTAPTAAATVNYVDTVTSGILSSYPALSSINGLTTSANKMIYTTASNTYATADISPFMRTLLDDANASTALTTLGAEPAGGGTYLPLSGGTLSGTLLLNGTQTASNAAATVSFVNSGLSTILSGYPALLSINGLTTSADKMIYTTASNTYATTDLSPFMRTLLDDTTASIALATLGGTNATGAGAIVRRGQPNIDQPTIAGVTNNTAAAAGNYAEFLTSTVLASGAVSVTNATDLNVTSKALTGGGDLDAYGDVTVIVTGGTISSMSVWISQTSATQPDLSLVNCINLAGMGTTGISAPRIRISFSSTTTVYLSVRVTITAGTATACGTLSLRRAR